MKNEVEKYECHRDHGKRQILVDQFLEDFGGEYVAREPDCGSESLWIVSSGFLDDVINF